MADEIFVLALGALYSLLLNWGFRHLPGEKWQILATIPTHKDAFGQWHGVNLTSYGLVTASAYAISLATLLILLGAVAVPLPKLLVAAGTILAMVVPASRLVARLIEKKRYTFTVGGAAFVGIVVAPWVILGVNMLMLEAPPLPLMPTLGAFAVAYAFGEGVGRLACISFGCCYGRPLAACHPNLQRLFRNKHFVFQGKIKKIAYEGRMDGEKVVPIQAVTCAVYIAAGLFATLLFLNGRYTAALLLALAVTQLWRLYSETLRADYRGGGARLSAYQVLALLGMVYVGFVAWLAPTAATAAPDVLRGLESLWNPVVIVFVQAVWVATFVYAGRSMVTRSTVSIHLCEEHI